MEINEFVWLNQVEDKIIAKHLVQPHEAEEVFFNQPDIEFVETGHHKGENLYAAFGQTDTGRHVVVLFILKRGGKALVITAREMTRKEKHKHAKK